MCDRRLLSRVIGILLLSCGIIPLRGAESSAKAAHVVVVVWDGMRPDFITPENTPYLHALVQRGTFFANHHSHWVTTTEVNGTVLATGVFPSRSHIVANREFRPDIEPRGAVAMEAPETIRRGDALTNGHYLGALTIAEIARQAGFSTAIAGTKPVALLHDRAVTRPSSPRSATIFAGKAYPFALLAPLTQAFGPFPSYRFDEQAPQPFTAGNRWTTRALLEHLWREEVPCYSVLWLSDPDFPQHVTAPGHPAALAGIRDSDAHLGMVVSELEKRGVLAQTDLFVVSDHGFSTIERTADAVSYFNDHGVAVVREFHKPPTKGQAICVNVGGASGLYVMERDAAVIARLVELLQVSDFAGPIFTRDALPGTFALRTAQLDSPAAPDIVFSFRWREGANAHGVPGLIVAEGPAGKGTHGTLSRFDIRNTLVAAGPHIRADFRSEFPSGNIDVAPTILHLLGLTSPDGCDGRVLTEALADSPLPNEVPRTRFVEATREVSRGFLRRSIPWRQHLKTTTFAGKTYIDEGNANSGH